jgi:chromosome partitioning protein
VFNLAGVFAARGQRCLLVDLDSQASLTRALSDEPVRDDQGIGYRLSYPQMGLASAIRPIGKRIDLAPGDRTIEAAANALKDNPGGPLRLLQLIDSLPEPYDVVLIDTAPALGFTQSVALMSSDLIVVPTRVGAQVDIDALSDIFQIHADFTGLVRYGLRPPGQIVAILPTAFNDAHAPQQEGYAILRETYDGLVTAPIPYSALVDRAFNARRPVVWSKPTSRVARGFTALADTLHRHHGELQAKRAQVTKVGAA